MQWFETGLVVLVLLGAVGVLVFTPKTWMRWVYVLATGTALWIQLGGEGPHWQMLPLYFATTIVLVMQFAPLGDWDGSQVPRVGAWLAIPLCLLSVAFATILPMFQLPKPTGPYAVGTVSQTLVDRTRAEDGASRPTADHWRELPVQLWFPAEPKTGTELDRYTNASELTLASSYKAEIRTNARLMATPKPGKFPVLLFGPRWAGARVQDTFLAEELASHGYIVVAIDHPYNAALALTDEGVIASDRAGALSIGPQTTVTGVEGAWTRELEIWKADDKAVLDALARWDDPIDPALKPKKKSYQWTGLYGRLDMSRVGAFGHSFGGASSLALLGTDPRIKSAVNLDGWTFQGLDHRTTQPILAVYEGSSEVRHPETGVEGQLDHDDNRAVDSSLEQYGGLRAYVAGTQHLDFTDQTLVSPFRRLTHTGPIAGERIRTITRGLVVGFFDQTLKGSGAIPAYPEVHLQSFPARP